jgi:hypothetical protein
MFEWLAEEIATIKTRDFHKTAPRGLLAELQRELPKFPASYLEFLSRFGDTWFFREIGRSSWAMRLFGRPELVTHEKTERELQFLGWSEGAAADIYFDDAQLAPGAEVSVIVGAGGRLRETGLTFDAWLEQRAQQLRKRYGKRAWQKVLSGPPPFNDQERAVIEARRHFEWRIVGITDDKCIQFQVTNRSKITLRGLSVDVRGPNLVGGTSLPVGSIGPGETRIVAVDCYKDLVDPAETRITIPVEPEPESRGEYFELRTLAEKG